MACEIHLNDIGTEFRITIIDCASAAIDISSATSLNMIFKKPSGTTVTQTATAYDATNGILTYTTVDGDLTEIGTWKIQAQVVATNGTWKSEFKSFKVHRNL